MCKCNQLYSVSLINFGPITQNNQPWLGRSKLHSKFKFVNNKKKDNILLKVTQKKV